MENIAASFSTGKEAYAHDIRKSIKGNVDKDRIQDNITLIDELKGKSIDSYIDSMMQPTIDEYNAKQKKKCRRIDTPYTEWHKSNGTLSQSKLVYEAVAQVGEHETLGKRYYKAKGQEKEELQDFFEDFYRTLLQQFQKKYPHLKVLWATIHFDEPRGTPHCHIAFTPIGEYEKQGLSKKISIGRALELDGITRVKDKTEAMKLGGYQLTKLYREVKRDMEQMLLQQGFTLKQEQHGKKHQTVEEWEAVQALKQEQVEEQKKLEQTQKQAAAYIDFSKELEDIKEAANRGAYDTKQIQKVQVRDGFKKKEVYQMDETTFRQMQSTADTKAIQRDVEYKIAKQQKATEKLVQSLTTEKEEQLQDQIQDLRQELAHAHATIKEKDRTIKKLQQKLEDAKEFIQSLGIVQKFKAWYEQRQMEREGFYFEGQTIEE